MCSQPSVTFWVVFTHNSPTVPGFDVDARVGVDHPDLDPGQRPADRPHAVRIAMIVGQQGRVGAEGLGLAEHVGETPHVASRPSPCAPMLTGAAAAP